MVEGVFRPEQPLGLQVTRMLPIQGRDELVGIPLGARQERHLELDAEQVAGLGAQRPAFDRQHRAAEDDVYLDPEHLVRFVAFQDIAYGITGPISGVLAARADYSLVFFIGALAARACIGLLLQTTQNPP